MLTFLHKTDARLRSWLPAALSVAAVLGFCPISGGAQAAPTAPLELTRAARPWEFLSVLGKRAAVLGKENGHLEGWVYPLKLFRDLHVNFLIAGRAIPGETMLRSIEVRPESTTLVYVADAFSVRETIFVPRTEPSLIIRFDVTTTQPMELQVGFHKDLRWMWPAPTGDTDINYVPSLHAFVLDSLDNKYAAVAGSPTGHDYLDEYETNAVTMTESSVKLGPVARGNATQYFAAAASFTSLQDAEALYKDVLTHASEWQSRDAAAYATYIDNNLKLQLPDPGLQQAYEWGQISMVQMLVDNPFLGTGLVAGFDESGSDVRPGYAWFFGRDTLWTSFALNAEQDFATTRTAIEFLAKYQRADGKVTHEIAQGASFVPWFTKMPFAYASADATPLFIIGVNDYVQRSGDIEFARQMWDNSWRAYQFLVSTYDAKGFAQNQGVGHGWIEGGALYPLYSELYQNALATEALRSLSQLAKVLGRTAESQKLTNQFTAKQKLMESTFWMDAQNHYGLAVDANGKLVDISSVLSTVPMWFGLLDQNHVDRALTDLSGPDQQTDWGMRILSAKDTRFDPSGYHFGTVWPLFTGWASVAEFRYHHPLAATQNLEANAQLTFDGSLGHVAEVLSGTFYSTSQTASPNQLWSAAMVVDPLVRGMLGLEPNAIDHTLRFTPHVPADWTSFKVDHLRVGNAQISLSYQKALDAINLDFHSDAGRSTLIFSPALSLRARVRDVVLDGKRVPFHIEANADDQHVVVSAPVTAAAARLTVHVEDEFGITEPQALPQLGSTSQGVHVVTQTWSPDHKALTLQIAELTDKPYVLGIWNPRQIASVDGAEIVPVDAGHALLRLPASPQANGDSQNLTVVLHFTARTEPHSTNRDKSPAGGDR